MTTQLDIPRSKALTNEQADDLAAKAVVAISNVQTAEDAESLLAQIAVADEARRVSKLGEERERQWCGVKLMGERRYGELLPPKSPGGKPKKDTVSATNSNNERQAQAKARKVAAIPQEKFEVYVETAEKPSRAGLLKATAEPKEARPRQQTESGAQLWEYEPVLEWVAKRVKAKRTRDQIVAESKAGTDGWPIAGKHLPQNGVDRVLAILKDRKANPRSKPRQKNHNGKSNATRSRELKEQTASEYLKLRRFQGELNKMCEVLEDWEVVNDCDLDDLSLRLIVDVYDDLLSLGEWWDRSQAAAGARLATVDLHRKITALRNTAGRTPEEADTALRLADRLEQKMERTLKEAA